MRDRDERGDGLFSYVEPEARVPADHPLRAIRVLVDEALAAMSGDFAGLYSKTGRPSNAPEKLLQALLLQAFYTLRSERQLPDSKTGAKTIPLNEPTLEVLAKTKRVEGNPYVVSRYCPCGLARRSGATTTTSAMARPRCSPRSTWRRVRSSAVA